MNTPCDLYRFGNQTGPREPRLNHDLFPDTDGMVGPESGPPWNGISTYANLAEARMTGHYHRLPAGTELPDGLAVIADGLLIQDEDVLPPSHHTIYPARRMKVQELIEVFRHLPWHYGGKL